MLRRFIIPHFTPLCIEKKGDQPWKEISKGLPCGVSFIHTLAADPAESGVFYAMNHQGIYRLNVEHSRWDRIEMDWKNKYFNQHPSYLIVKDE